MHCTKNNPGKYLINKKRHTNKLLYMVTYLFLIIAELFIYQLDANIIYNLILIYIVFFSLHLCYINITKYKVCSLIWRQSWFSWCFFVVQLQVYASPILCWLDENADDWSSIFLLHISNSTNVTVATIKVEKIYIPDVWYTYINNRVESLFLNMLIDRRKKQQQIIYVN